jgi:glycine cleavage system H protein
MTTLYTSDHEWLRIEGDVATIGVTDYAQSQLGDVVFVELPKVGRSLKKAEAAAVVEVRQGRLRRLRADLGNGGSE